MDTFKTCLVAVIMVVLGSSGAGAKPCSRQDAIRAEQQASTLKTWAAIHQSFKSFAPQCDDGAISEGYSESVSRLLAKDWSDLRALGELTGEDAGFEQFVLQHIDETISRDYLNILLSNAQRRCPDQNKDLCDKISKRARLVNSQSN